MNRSAFTLVEVLVALVILEVGLLAAVGLFTLATRAAANAQRTEQGLALVEALADSLLGSDTVVDGVRRTPAGDSIVWRREDGGRVTVDFRSSERGVGSFAVAIEGDAGVH